MFYLLDNYFLPLWTIDSTVTILNYVSFRVLRNGLFDIHGGEMRLTTTYVFLSLSTTNYFFKVKK